MTAQLIPYLAVRDARAAMDWYADALGARVVGDPYVMDDNRIGHAELDVSGAPLYLADEHPELGLTAPDEGRISVTLHLSVPDVDAAVARAETVGATVERPPTDAPYGRTAVIVDPYGHRWMLQTPSPPASTGARPGAVGHLQGQVDRVARTRTRRRGRRGGLQHPPVAVRVDDDGRAAVRGVGRGPFHRGADRLRSGDGRVDVRHGQVQGDADAPLVRATRST